MSGKNEGIAISGGGIRADQLAVGRGAKIETMRIGGGANVDIGSHLTGVQQTGGATPSATSADEQDLQELLKTLTALLEKAPADKSDEAQALSAQAAQLVETAAKDNPNRTMLHILGKGIKDTAEFLKDAVPGAVTVAEKIVSLVVALHGVGL
jgi:ElaB/YqjD/DUF883 family membrane-anchored ribosome-binding protein